MSYTIGQTAEKLNLTNDTLRYYEKMGLLPKIKKNASGNRVYTEADLEKIDYIQCFKKTGMSLKDLKALIELDKKGPETLSERAQILLEHKNHVLDQISELESYLVKIDHKLALLESKKK